ncbi:sulfotransferase [Pararhodospirillum oryzae]|uniref:Uncharacterized protein n=1 Tax=Pararhodospirillum oryzae TaxID=478448 RepID=A0A512H3K1_9PROT|nr:sulfotransferase [Pararhodospirillum oryzae]GEO79980.1 hypothetical protein ROR02_01110 [Pararhodospirillum oryzae]
MKSEAPNAARAGAAPVLDVADLLAAGEDLDGPAPGGAPASGIPVAPTPPARPPGLDHIALALRAERVRASQSPVFFAQRQGHGDPSRLPLFLVGMASPTAKRVRAILAAHSRVQAVRPLALIPAFIDTLEAWDRHCGRGGTFPESLESLSADDSLKAAAWWLPRLQREAPGFDHVLDGLALDATLVGMVHVIFPRAPLIVCVDDSVEASASPETRRLLATQAAMLDHWRQVLPGRLHELRRETLLAQPVETVRALLAFLDVPVEERVLNAITAPADGERPKTPGAAVGAAVAHIRAGRLAQADQALRDLLRRVPGHPAAVHLLGVVRFRQGDPASAVRLMRQSLDLVGTPVREWLHNLAVARRALEGTAAPGKAVSGKEGAPAPKGPRAAPAVPAAVAGSAPARPPVAGPGAGAGRGTAQPPKNGTPASGGEEGETL